MMKHVSTSGAAAINYSFVPTKPVYVKEVRLHMSAAGGAAENFTITLDSALGALFDVVFHTVAMAAVSDVVWVPSGNQQSFLGKGDKLVIAYANTNSRNYGLEIVYV